MYITKKQILEKTKNDKFREIIRLIIKQNHLECDRLVHDLEGFDEGIIYTRFLNYTIAQVVLFDLSDKIVFLVFKPKYMKLICKIAQEVENELIKTSLTYFKSDIEVKESW